jgi:hypothetical protein
MVHGILAARLDAVPEAIECADGPPPLLAAFSSPPGTMNRGGMQANDAEALHRETTVGTSREGHRGLAGRVIVGGLRTTAQERNGGMIVIAVPGSRGDVGRGQRGQVRCSCIEGARLRYQRNPA